ncbi:MAG: hypothetical protein ACYTA5_10500 [Planctomycetota bacterium]|jgi:hypothetical protein
MNEKIDDQLRRMYEAFDEDHDRLRDELMASLPEQVPQPRAVGDTKGGRHVIGDNKMIRRIGVTLAIAACLVLVILGYWPGSNGNGRVYGMADIPELLRNAKIIHIAPMQLHQQTNYPLETWIDVHNGRMRKTYLCSATGPNGTFRTLQQEYVSDGEFGMEVSHSEKWVEFYRMNAYQRRLQAHRDFYTMLDQYFGNPENFKAFMKTGSETIDGKVFDIWECEAELVYNQRIKIKCWFAPYSGEIGRVQRWHKNQERNDNFDWHLDEDVRIERNIFVQPHIFDTVAPAGYTLNNTKALAAVTKPTMVSLGGPDFTITIHIGFMLKDESVIIGWSSEDKKAEESQAGLFRGLVFGGPLPRLPMELYRIKSTIKDGDAFFSGYHLGHTQQNGKYYEWSIYVSPQPSPKHGFFTNFNSDYRLNIAPDRTKPGQGSMGWRSIWIDNKQDFDQLVLGAMAELSDDGEAPDYIIYERVMELSAKLREEFAEKNKR